MARGRVSAVVAAAALLLASGAFATVVVSDAANALPAAGPVGTAAPVLPPADAGVGVPPSEVAGVLDPLLDDASLGGEVGAVVIDVATGDVLYSRDGASPRSLASNQKVFTSLAILDAIGPEGTITTTVTWEPSTSTLTLVGAGDPTLASVSATGSSLAALADQVAALVDGSVTLLYDTRLFSGPQIAPGWSDDYPATGVAAPVSALVVDRARTPGSDAREPDPARTAASIFAAQLEERGVSVYAVDEGFASGQVIATTESVPLATMVETMLTESDNDMAEILAHLAGAEASGTGSFASGASATIAALAAAGIPTQGAVFVDGSGLSYEDVASPLTLAQVVALATAGSAPASTWPIVLGLPVAGLTGTLADRFQGPETGGAAGFVRAKTGTLSGVSTLAGTVVDADGRLLAFALMSDGTTDVAASRDALDRAAAALAACGCRV